MKTDTTATLASFLRRLWAAACGRRGADAARAGGETEWMEDAEVDQLHAWHLSVRLATLPAEVEALCPPDVVHLIDEARSIHPLRGQVL